MRQDWGHKRQIEEGERSCPSGAIRKGFLEVEVNELVLQEQGRIMGIGRQQNILCCRNCRKCLPSLAKAWGRGREGEERKIRLGRKMGASGC